MGHKIKTLCVIVLFLSLLLAACGSPAQTSTPTPDLNPLRTEVAATVLAQVTISLLQTPSATPIPSPTALPSFTATSTQAASVTPGVTGTPPTGTPTLETKDLAQWVSQTVADNTLFAPNETFTMTWRLKNVGITTWSAAYLLRFYSGEAFGANKEISLGKEVRPGESVDISLKMKAPVIPGDYRSDWVLSNASRSNFKDAVFLKITVPGPRTPTPTPRTPTPTAVP